MNNVIQLTEKDVEDCPIILEACEKLYRKKYREICVLYCQVNDLDVRLLYPLDEEDYLNSILAGDSKFGYIVGKHPKDLFEQPTIKMSSHHVKQSDLPKPKNTNLFIKSFSNEMPEKDRIIKCPKPCDVKIITRFSEGIMIHTHHFDHIKNRRILHEIFIDYELLSPSADETNLPSITTYDKK